MSNSEAERISLCLTSKGPLLFLVLKGEISGAENTDEIIFVSYDRACGKCMVVGWLRTGGVQSTIHRATS
jgi:hypothetical protein